jgi:hypothetical protein
VNFLIPSTRKEKHNQKKKKKRKARKERNNAIINGGSAHALIVSVQSFPFFFLLFLSVGHSYALPNLYLPIYLLPSTILSLASLSLSLFFSDRLSGRLGRS